VDAGSIARLNYAQRGCLAGLFLLYNQKELNMVENKKTKRNNPKRKNRVTDYQALSDNNKIRIEDLDKSDWLWLLRN
jgi:hypothetical protein